MSDNILAFFLGLLWSVAPTVAFGAAVGAIILVNTIEEKHENKKYIFGISGSLIGYFIALPFIETKYAFLIALLSSSLSIYVIIATQRMINDDSGLPKWFTDLIKEIGEFMHIVRRGKK